MKNIYLIETKKLSKLYKLRDKLYLEEYPTESVYKANQHLYITSSEEIKEGWSYDRMMETVNKIDNVYSSKIILTTDQDLIKDGVQAIDDEFLEWFVKNPTCEIIPIITTVVNGEKSYKTNVGFEDWRSNATLHETKANLVNSLIVTAFRLDDEAFGWLMAKLKQRKLKSV